MFRETKKKNNYFTRQSQSGFDIITQEIADLC